MPCQRTGAGISSIDRVNGYLVTISNGELVNGWGAGRRAAGGERGAAEAGVAF